jgi:hypothetical protein
MSYKNKKSMKFKSGGHDYIVWMLDDELSLDYHDHAVSVWSGGNDYRISWGDENLGLNAFRISNIVSDFVVESVRSMKMKAFHFSLPNPRRKDMYDRFADRLKRRLDGFDYVYYDGRYDFYKVS